MSLNEWLRAQSSVLERRFSAYAPYIVLAAALLVLPLLAAYGARAEVVTAFVAVATLSVNQSFELARRRAEHQRWYAQQFMADKIESLKALFGALDSWYWAAIECGNTAPTTRSDFRQRLGSRDAEFLAVLSRAQIYLSQEDDKTIRYAMSALRRANVAVFHQLPDSEFPAGRKPVLDVLKEFPWDDLLDRRESAKDVIRKLLNPRILQELEKALQ